MRIHFFLQVLATHLKFWFASKKLSESNFPGAGSEKLAGLHPFPVPLEMAFQPVAQASQPKSLRKANGFFTSRFCSLHFRILLYLPKLLKSICIRDISVSWALPSQLISNLPDSQIQLGIESPDPPQIQAELALIGIFRFEKGTPQPPFFKAHLSFDQNRHVNWDQLIIHCLPQWIVHSSQLQSPLIPEPIFQSPFSSKSIFGSVELKNFIQVAWDLKAAHFTDEIAGGGHGTRTRLLVGAEALHSWKADS